MEFHLAVVFSVIDRVTQYGVGIAEMAEDANRREDVKQQRTGGRQFTQSNKGISLSAGNQTPRPTRDVKKRR